MDAFVAQELFAGLDPGGHDFAEFFRSSTLSLTVARWPAGSVDDQEPHTEDEVYYVVSGRARLRVADEDAAVPQQALAQNTVRVLRQTRLRVLKRLLSKGVREDRAEGDRRQREQDRACDDEDAEKGQRARDALGESRVRHGRKTGIGAVPAAHCPSFEGP